MHGDWIARWSPEGRATWRLASQADARYQVSVRLRCPEAEAETYLRAEAGGASVERALTACLTLAEQEVGLLHLPAGDVVLTLGVHGGGE